MSERLRFVFALSALTALVQTAPAAAQVADECQVAVAAQPGITISGDLNKNNSTSAIPADCVGENAGGPDAFYTLSMTSGFRYEILVQPASTLDVATAVWADCTLAENQCIDGSDAVGMSGAETITVLPSQDADVVIQVVGVDAVTGATTSKSKFSMRITETQIPVDAGPGDIGGEDVAVPVESTTDAAVVDEGGVPADTSDEGPAQDPGLRDSGVMDTAASLPDGNGTTDTAPGTDLAGWHENDDGDGCTQGRTPSAMAPLLLLVALLVLRRTRFNT